MRISDWSSDVCSSDLAAAFTVPCRATSRKASMLVRGGRRAMIVSGDDDMPPRAAPDAFVRCDMKPICGRGVENRERPRSEEHTSELQSLMRISYAVFCLKKKNTII